jgi:RHS repeat-associated protein
VISAWNQVAAGTPGSATIHFPAAGTYPYELDYSECGGGGLYLALLTAQFIAQTDPLSVYVGYADGLRPSGSIFPFPWDGSPGVTFVGGCTFDAGALRFDNSGNTDITLDKVTVDIAQFHFDIWPANLVVPAHAILILTQTGCYNFDTSDFSGTGCGVSNNVLPLVNVTRGGVTTTSTDTNQVLNTHGFDSICQGNESISWQRIAGTANTINVPLPPGASLNLTPFSVPGAIQGQSLALTVSALDGVGNPVPNLPISLRVFGANAQPLNATTLANGLATFTYTGLATGTDTVQASAFISGLREISNQGTVTWSAPGGAGSALAPSITNQSPADGAVVTKPVAVDATIAPPAGQSIASWRVFYQPLSGGPQVVIRTGTGTPPSPLGVTLDPTLIADGAYSLTIEATADNGAVQDITSGIVVSGGLKLGRYTTTVSDLSVPVDGFQMQVLRTYDSIDSSIGDFGVGWRVDLTNFRVSSNHTLGAGGWTQYNKSCVLGLCFTAFKNAAPRYVIVVFPDQHTEIFDFTPQGGTNIFWSCTPQFTARASVGTTSTLVPLDDTGCSYTGDGNIYGSSGAYNPQRFQLTTRDGRVFVLDHTLGLISETDRNGNRLSIDSAGVHSTNGQSIAFTRDSSGRIIRVTGPSGQVLTYTYSAAGDLATSTDPNGNVTTYSYDSSHHLLSVLLNGVVRPIQSQEYDASGRLIAIIDGAGNRTVVSNSVPGQTIAVVDSLGTLTTVTHMDDLGDVTELDQTTGGQTLTTSFTYDSVGRLLSRADPLGKTTSMTYSAQGDVTSYTDADGHTTRFTYDSSGTLTSAIGPDGTVLDSITYNSAGRPTQLQTADGSIKTFTYDSAGRATSVTDSLGRTVAFTYDSNGHAASMTDPTGGTTSMTNDASGQLLSASDPAGNRITFTYDADGNLLSITDPSGRKQSNTYDAFGRTLTATDATGKVSTYTYDATGRLTSVVDRSGNTTSFNYDADGNLIKGTYPGGDATNFAYDGFGRLINMANATSSVASTYDASSRIVSQRETLPVVGAVTTSYTYDAVGNRTSMTSADGTTHYSYDVEDRLISMIDPVGGSFAFTYSAQSQLVSLSRPNGVVDAFTYDSTGKLTSRTATHAGSTVALSSQTFDANGQVASRTDLGGTSTYTHDSTGQLVGVAAPGGATSSYVYDTAGNRVSDPLSSSMTYDPANRLLSDSNYAYTYDAEGNRISRTSRSTGAVTHYVYDAHGQLASVQNPDGTTTSFTYDVLGRRVQVTTGGQTTTYAYDGANVHLEYAGTSQVASYTDPFATDHPLEMRRGGQSYYYLSDVAGNITGLSDATGSTAATYSYDAFGVPTNSTGTVTNPFTYAGREFDSKSGLYYNRARYYEPTTGRFLSEDPAPSVNSYNYVRNDPVDFNDPTGAGIWDYLINTFRATASQRFIGCAMAVFAVGLEYIVGWFFKGKIDLLTYVANAATACAFGALLPGVGPTSTAGQFGWFIFIIPILLALVAALLDVIQQLRCSNAQHPYDPGHTLVVFVMAFAIAHYFGIWGAAAGALKGVASGAAATAIGVTSGGSAGLADQIPGGACG